MEEKEWNPRYLAYARSQKRTPEEQLAHDKAVHPDACMLEFILWLGTRWDEWKELQSPERKHAARHGWMLNWEDYQSFDAFLSQRYQGERPQC